MWLGWWTDWQDLPSGQKLLWNCNSSMRIDGERCWFSSCRVGLLCARAGWEQGWETELETNPVFLFFVFFSPGSKIIQLRGFAGRCSDQWVGLLNLVILVFCILGALNGLGQVSAHHSHGSAGCHGSAVTATLGSCQCPLGDSSHHRHLGDRGTHFRHHKNGAHEHPSQIFSIPSAFVPSPASWKWKISFPQFAPSNCHYFQHEGFSVNLVFWFSLAVFFLSPEFPKLPILAGLLDALFLLVNLNYIS